MGKIGFAVKKLDCETKKEKNSVRNHNAGKS